MPDSYQYHAFGLNIDSAWPIFQLSPQLPIHAALPNISITQGKIATYGFPPESEKPTGHFFVKGNAACIYVSEVANFIILDGQKIVVELAHNADPQTVNLYLLGTAIGTLLHQRGALPLHGNAIQVGDSAVIVVANSGVGKSTLAGEFNRRGFSVLADDVCTITSDKLTDRPRVHASYAYLKLWHDAIKNLDLNTDKNIRISEQRDKFYVPVASDAAPTSLPVKSIYIMRKADISETQHQALLGWKKSIALSRFIYRPGYLHKLATPTTGYQRVVSLFSDTPVTRIVRPAEGMHVSTIASLILENEQRQGNATAVTPHTAN